MPRKVTPDATDQTEYFYIVEDVGGTNPGEPKTGLTHSNIDAAYYTRTRAVAVQIGSLSTLAAANTAHTDGGFKEIDSTNQPGVYRFDPPDAAYASNAAEVIISLKVAGASNAIARPVKVILETQQTADVADGVTLADGVTHGGTTAKLRLGSTTSTVPFQITNSGGPAAEWTSSHSGSAGAFVVQGLDRGVFFAATNTGGAGMFLEGGTGGYGLYSDHNFYVEIFNVNSVLVDTTTVLTGAVTATNASNDIRGIRLDATGLQTDAVEEIRNAITGYAGALDTDANGAVRIVDGTGTRELNTSGGFIAGIAGTINTLDALDTAQDVEHDATQAAIAALNNITAASVWAAGTRTLTAGTNIVLAKGTGVTGFTDLSAAEVNAEIVDALNADQYAEPGQGTPAATTTLVTKIGMLYKALINPHAQTATEFKLYNNAGTVVDHKATVADDLTTFTRTRLLTGP